MRKKESESTSSAMPTSARWFWDIFGALIFAVVVGLGVKSTFDRATPIPVASELVELSGVVADVQVEKRRVHYDSNTYEIAGFSFELEGREGRWEIPERHRYYEPLARGLVPGVEARLLVANADWVAEHGEPLAVEQLWGAEVDGEPVVSLAQMTAAARRSRENPEPWWPFVIVALASLACFAHGRLWGGGSRA